MQYKKIEIYGRDLEDFKPKRNPMSECIYSLTHNEAVAIEHLVRNQIIDGDVKFLLSIDEAEKLIKKLRKNIGYEEIR